MSHLLRTLSQSEGSGMALERLRRQEADIEVTITRQLPTGSAGFKRLSPSSEP